MNKSAQVNAIYHELREAMGERATQKEVLQCAYSLVELFSTDNAGPRCELRTGGVPFENWSLDAAFADGGWRIFWYEMHRGMEMDSDDWEGMPPNLLDRELNLEGLTWRM